MQLSLVYRISIIMICAGIVALGAKDLYKMHRDKKLVNKAAENIIAELRDDPYARLATGAPIEQVGARGIEQRRASYPWERTELQEENKVELSFIERLEQAIVGHKKVEEQAK